MIDEKINNSLKELEQGLKNIESARKQVEKTVNSYEGLKASTNQYVNNLGIITQKINDLVETIGESYKQKSQTFDKDRQAVIDASRNATEKLSKATDEFNISLNKIKKILNTSLILNVITLVAIAVIIFTLMK